MRRAATITTVALVTVCSGCVQQDKFDATLQSNRTLEDQIRSLETQRNVASSNLSTMRERLGQAKEDNSALQARIAKLDEDLNAQSSKYDELLRRVAQLEFGPLPVELEIALEQLASAYTELLTFDASTGMLRFASDFTFDLGSAELKPSATATISTLADILNAEQAAAFELRVIGHTDNVPIERPTTLRQHPTNVHLSVHRAISVRDALVRAGVEPQRIQVAGYGEFRPMVPNGPKGAAENRRVELLLVPMKTHLSERESTQTPDQPQTVTVEPEK